MKRYSDNDINLIGDLKKGKPKAYSFLLHTYHHKLCVYAINLSKDKDLSEDIVQNVFVNVWKNRQKLKDDFVVKNYLYKSVFNQFIDQYRKSEPVISLSSKHLETLDSIIENEDENSLKKMIELVLQQIEKLPPKCKQTFLLSKKEGLSNQEISEYLNISIKSVEAHITKAFSVLRKSTRNKITKVLFLLFTKLSSNRKP